MSHNEKPRHSGLITALSVLIAILIAAIGVMIYLCLDMANRPLAPAENPTDSVIRLPEPTTLPTVTPPTTQPPTTVPEPEHVVSTATVSVQGDLLMHKPIFTSGTAVQQGGVYDFSPIFRYIQDYISSYDYALANLETTFGGNGYVYQGWPNFNCPDPFADALVGAGYDMLLTANNHSYDTEMTGLTRTLEQLRQRELETLGSRLSQEEKRYSIVEVNGIRLGMVCYTYTTSMDGSRPRLNGNNPVKEPELINWFSYNRQDELFSALEQIMADMRAEGAEAFILYTHWGEEYSLTPNDHQRTIAQKACDLGFDAIVGGHPHVVQPMELLTSTQDPNHKAVCLYSMGNAVSNQRIAEMRMKTGHTEDGVLLTLTFEKYSDGTVYLAETDVLPTWVNLHYHNGSREYNILPLDDDTRETWKTLYQLSDGEFTAAENSYKRTMDLVGPGLDACQTHLAEEKQAREDYYWDLATNGAARPLLSAKLPIVPPGRFPEAA